MVLCLLPPRRRKIYYYKEEKVVFGNVLINAIKKAIDTVLLICGIVTIFLLLSSIVIDVFKLKLYDSMIMKGILEITIGIEALSRLGLPMVYKAVIASCFLAFGGFSVHMQVLSQLTDTNIKYKYFFIGRLYQMVLSGIITYIIFVICY